MIGLIDREVKLRVKLDFILHTPKNQKENFKYPLIVYLHGAGERSKNLDSIGDITQGNLFGTELDTYLAVPLCPHNEMWDIHSIKALIDTLITSENLSIDPSRIYLAGHSMGARGCWDFATTYPDVLAAMVPMSGFSCYLKAAKIRKLPIWCFHSQDDDIVPFIESVKMISCLDKKAAKFTPLNGVGHDTLWVLRNIDIQAWLLRQRK